MIGKLFYVLIILKESKVVWSIAWFPFDIAADAGFLIVGIRLLIGEKGIESVFEGFTGEGKTIARTAIIELAAIDEFFLCIEEVEFRSAGGTVCFGDRLIFVKKVGESKVSFFYFFRHHDGVIFWVAIGVIAADGKDGDTFILIFFAEFCEFRMEVFNVRAVIAHEDDKIGFGLVVVVKINEFTSEGFR